MKLKGKKPKCKKDKSNIFVADLLSETSGVVCVTKHKVLKETEKQYQCEKTKVNKGFINSYTNTGRAYAFSEEEAIALVEEYLGQTVEDLKARIARLNNCLENITIERKDTED